MGARVQTERASTIGEKMNTKKQIYNITLTDEDNEKLNKIASKLKKRNGTVLNRLVKLSFFFGLHEELVENDDVINDIVGVRK